MTTELYLLLASAALAFLHSVPYVAARISSGGWTWAFGNRDRTPETPPWAARAARAHANLVENLPLFAIVVLVAHAAGVHNRWTVLGAYLFVGARTAYWVVYTAGIPVLRTLIFHTANAALVLIAAQVL